MLGEFVISLVLFCHSKNLNWRVNPCYSSVLKLGLCCRSVLFPQFCLATAKLWSNWSTSVTAQCYSSVLFGKQRKIHPQGMRVGRPKRSEENRSPILALVFMFVLLPLTCPMQIGLARRAVCFTWGLQFGPQTFLCSIFTGFSLLCLLAIAILDSFFLF